MNAPQDVEIEREANIFAMELLMPEKFVRAKVSKMGGVDIVDETGMKKLAKQFGVSTTMMAMRVGEIYAARTADPARGTQG